MPGYDEEFYTEIGPGAESSAGVIAPMLVDALRPSSVVDLGCGTGEWLAAFRAAGVGDVLGLDGDYVDRSSLKIPVENFRAVDLNRPVRIDRRFDLALSLEVAEHLLPARAESFVADLVSLAPTVCFSAAVPLQGGVDHMNERWQDEWASIFADHGYRPVDLVRGRVWDDPRVKPWYAQNILIYVAAGVGVDGDHLPLRLVHPERYMLRLSQTISAVEHPAPLGAKQLAREAGRTAKLLVKRGREALAR